MEETKTTGITGNDSPQKLMLSEWLTEEIKKGKNTMEYLRRVLGIFEYDENVTVSYLRGYLSALKTVELREDL